jgi:hypothetical protein
MKKMIWIVSAIAVVVFGMGQYVKWSNADLADLTKLRRSTLAELRPVLLRYKAETGSFPPSLELLVPKHLSKVPPELQSQADVEPAKRIQYERVGDTARFTYHVIRGPDSTEAFDVASNKFQRNK